MIRLHNPFNNSLQVNEVYTSDDDLHLALPAINEQLETNSFGIQQMNNLNLKVSHLGKLHQRTNQKRMEFSNRNKEFWVLLTKLFLLKNFASFILLKIKHLNGFETRNILLLRYMGRHTGSHTAFICIKLSQEEYPTSFSFVLPIELEVAAYDGLFSTVEKIRFGDQDPIIVPPHPFNTGDNLLLNSAPSTLAAASPQILTSPFTSVRVDLPSAIATASTVALQSFDLFLINTASVPLEIKVS